MTFLDPKITCILLFSLGCVTLLRLDYPSGGPPSATLSNKFPPGTGVPGSLAPYGGSSTPIEGSNAGAPSSSSGAVVPMNHYQDDLDLHNVPPEYKKEGSDWYASFNPQVKKDLDVGLVYTLTHERYSALHALRFDSSTFIFILVWCAVSNFPLMGGSWLPAVTEQPRFTIPRREQKLGMFAHPSLIHHIPD